MSRPMLVVWKLKKLLYISVERVLVVLDLEVLLLFLLELAHRVHFELVHVYFELVVDQITRINQLGNIVD